MARLSKLLAHCGADSGEPMTKPTISRAACCGDPTPNAATGACCTDPAADCGCQSPALPERADPRSTSEHTPSRLPVAIIGAGPIGLAAAAHLLEKGETAIVLEAHTAVG